MLSILESRQWPALFASAAFLALCHPDTADLISILPAFAGSLTVNAILFIIPAIGWRGVFFRESRALGSRLFEIIFLSFLIVLLALVLVFVFFPALTLGNFLVVVWAISALGYFVKKRSANGLRRRRSLTVPEVLLAGGVFFVSYAAYFVGATQVVPALDDHDLEIQGTGYGLVTRFEPLLLTDRDGVYFFAHPLLLHYYVGTSFLLYDNLIDLKKYDEISDRARNVAEGFPVSAPSGRTSILVGKLPEGHGLDVEQLKPPSVFEITGQSGDDYILQKEGGGATFRIPADVAEVGRIYQQFYASPNLLEGRTPNLFFGASTVALLVLWIGRLSRRRWIGILAGIAFASIPEVFVRSSYGGYFSISMFGCLGMLLAIDHWRNKYMSTGVGMFAALANHKLVILPIAYGMVTAWNWVRMMRHSAPDRSTAYGLAYLFKPVLVGFLLGTVLFWIYGFSIDHMAFYQDHIRQHLINRVAGMNYLGYWGYPTRLDLWKEMIAHCGYVLIPGAAFLFILDATSSARSSICSPAIKARYLWLLYALVLSCAFTLIDWRMTKHLMPLLLPVMLLISPMRCASRTRVFAAATVFMLAIPINIASLLPLIRNFDSYVVSPAW